MPATTRRRRSSRPRPGSRSSSGTSATTTPARPAITQVEAELGPVEILVNNAGITRDAPFHRMTPEQWQQVMSTNVDCLFNMTRPVIEGMREPRASAGSSTSARSTARRASSGRPTMPRPRPACIGFTKALAQERRGQGHHGQRDLPGLYRHRDGQGGAGGGAEDASILPQIPVGRLGEPEEIARCVAFLASDDAGFITGSTLSANGGQYMA